MTISTQRLRFLRGNTAATSAFTGLQGELIIDTDLYTIRIQDGVTPGGHALPTLESVAAIANAYSYGNANVQAFLHDNPSAVVNYNDANVARYLQANPQQGLYGNSNVQAYFNSNIAPSLYSNATAASYLLVHTGNINATYYTGNASLMSGLPDAYSNVKVQAYLDASLVPSLYSDSNVASYLAAHPQAGLYGDANVQALLPQYTGNVTATYFIGDGRYLTGLPPTYSNTNAAAYLASRGITNYSNLNVASYLANVGITNYANSNVADYLADQAISSYSNANAAAYLAAQSITPYSNTNTQSYLTSVNITAYSNANVASYLTANPQQGLYGNSNVAIYLAAQNISSYSNNNAFAYLNARGITPYSNVNVAGYLDNGFSVTAGPINFTASPPAYSTPGIQWNNGFQSSYFGNTEVAAYLASNIAIRTTANITAGYLFGNGALLTGLAATYSNANVASYLPTYTGNISANIVKNGQAWTFGNDGSTTFPNGAKLDGGTAYKFATDNSVTQYLDLRDSAGRGFYTDTSGYTLRSNGTYNWIFGGDGNLSIPNTGFIKYANGVNILTGLASTYGNTNVAAYLTSVNITAYSNTNVASYLAASNITSYSNTNVAAYLTASNITAYSNTNVASYLATNIAFTTTANVTAGYFVGNGALLTGIAASSNYSNTNVAAYLASSTGNVSAGNIVANAVYISGSLTSYGVASVTTGANTSPVQGNVTGNSTSTSTTILTAAIPSAGTWQLVAQVMGSLANGQELSFALFDGTGTLVPNTESVAGYIGGGASYQGQGTAVWNVVTTGAVNYTVRAWTPGAVSGGTVVSTSSGRTGVSWTLLSTPIAVQATATGTLNNDYLYAQAQGQSVGTNSVVLPSTPTSQGTVSASTVTGNITLAAGKTYSLTAALSLANHVNNGELDYSWFNTASNTALGTGGGILVNSSSAQAGWQPVAQAILQPLATTNVAVKITFASNAASVLNASQSYLLVKEIGQAFSLSGVQNLSWPTSNLTTSNVTANSITANANIAATYFIGNGALLTGIAASSNYSNTNVAAYLASNIAFTTTANVTAGYFVGNGALLTGLTPSSSYSNTNVATYLANTNITIVTTGNITSGYLFGNGALITGLPAGNYSNTNVANYLLTNIAVGNVTTTGRLTGAEAGVTLIANVTQYTFGNTGNVNFPGNLTVVSNVTVGNVFATGYYWANGNVLTTGGAYANANVATYLANTNITIVTTGNITAGNISTTGVLTVTGNVSAGNITATQYGNSFGTTATYTGNVTVGNLAVNTNVTLGNVTGTTASLTGNVSAGNVLATLYGNVWMTTTTQITSTGNANVIVNPGGTGYLVVTNITPALFSNTVTVTGNTSVGNLAASGNVTVGNITGGGVRSTSANTAPTNPTVGDVWYNTSNDVTYRFTSDGTTAVWLDTSGPTTLNSGGATANFANIAAGNVTLTGNLSATNVTNKVAGFANAGANITLDNIVATVTTSGNRSLSLATVSGSFSAFVSGSYGISGGGNGGSANNLTITTTPSSAIMTWHFGAAGDGAVYSLFDTTNSRVYRITLVINASYINNFISIERLI